jgi:hypothetical protein
VASEAGRPFLCLAPARHRRGVLARPRAVAAHSSPPQQPRQAPTLLLNLLPADCPRVHRIHARRRGAETPSLCFSTGNRGSPVVSGLLRVIDSSPIARRPVLHRARSTLDRRCPYRHALVMSRAKPPGCWARGCMEARDVGFISGKHSVSSSSRRCGWICRRRLPWVRGRRRSDGSRGARWISFLPPFLSSGGETKKDIRRKKRVGEYDQWAPQINQTKGPTNLSLGLNKSRIERGLLAKTLTRETGQCCATSANTGSASASDHLRTMLTYSMIVDRVR